MGTGVAWWLTGNRLRAVIGGGAVCAADDLHGRSVADAFYEWLLPDHPDARAERYYRRATACR